MRRFFTSITIMLVVFVICLSHFETETTSSSFNALGQANIQVNCGKLDVSLEIYDKETGIKLEENEPFVIDKTYTIKIYNKGNVNCNLYCNLVESEMNTFSMYLEALTSQDRGYNLTLAKTSSVEPQVTLLQNKDLIKVTNFKHSDGPLVYDFTLSSRLIRQMAPYGVITDLEANIVLSVMAESIPEQ